MASNERLERLTGTYKDKGLCLVLGSGVSVASRLPDWETLLNRIMHRCFGSQGGRTYRDLKSKGYSLGAIAAMAENQCPSDLSFPEVVREALYQEFRYFRQRIDKWNHTEFFRWVQSTNPTLAAVGGLCAVKVSPRIFEPNPSIGGVVNFNIDSLLQGYVTARFRKHLVRTVERPSAGRLYRRINVYHVHGYLRFDRQFGNLQKEAPDRLVLTEHQYFDFFNEPNSIFHYTMMYVLREYSCLFVGLSMRDDNLRRMLHYSRSERLQSYRREFGRGAPLKRKMSKVTPHFALLPKREYGAPLRPIIEKSLQRLGTEVIWLSGFDQIPDILGQVYEAGGGRWSDVYG